NQYQAFSPCRRAAPFQRRGNVRAVTGVLYGDWSAFGESSAGQLHVILSGLFGRQGFCHTGAGCETENGASQKGYGRPERRYEPPRTNSRRAEGNGFHITFQGRRKTGPGRIFIREPALAFLRPGYLRPSTGTTPAIRLRHTHRPQNVRS